MDLHWRRRRACKSTAARDGTEKSDENREQELEVGVVAPIGWRGLAILLCSGIGGCVRIFCDWICRGRPRVWEPVRATEGLGDGRDASFRQAEVGRAGIGIRRAGTRDVMRIGVVASDHSRRGPEMARRRNTAASEKNLRPRAYQICVQRACSEVRNLMDLLQAELQFEKAAGRAASRTKKEQTDVR